MIKTLITADDFGFLENINSAIIDAILAKRVSSKDVITSDTQVDGV